MKFTKYLIGAVIGFLGMQTVWADPAATQALIQDLANYQQVQGAFVQTIYDKNQAVLQQSEGTFALSRAAHAAGANNGKFRWDTNKPSQQLLIADGKKIWLYDKSLQQVTVKPQQSSANQASPAMLLSGDLTQLSKQYQVEEQVSSSKQVFKLTPLKDALFSQLKIVFSTSQSAATPVLSGMEITDSLGQKTQIQFSNLQSIKTTANLFSFTPPAGVDVIQAGT